MPSPQPVSLDMEEAHWPDPKKGPWRIRTWYDISTGVPRCVGVDVRSFDEEPPEGAYDAWLFEGVGGLRELTTTELRKLPFAEVARRGAERMPEHYEAAIASGDVPDDDEWRARRDAYSQGARRYSLSHLKAVAKTYSANVAGGAPTAAVADEFGLSRSAAAKQVARCRELGLLGRTVKGRPGGGRKGGKR